jgi:hypothetical protein
MQVEGELKSTLSDRLVGDRQIRYDLKLLVAVLNFATVARDDWDVPLLTHNSSKGLPIQVETARGARC